MATAIMLKHYGGKLADLFLHRLNTGSDECTKLRNIVWSGHLYIWEDPDFWLRVKAKPAAAGSSMALVGKELYNCTPVFFVVEGTKIEWTWSLHFVPSRMGAGVISKDEEETLRLMGMLPDWLLEAARSYR